MKKGFWVVVISCVCMMLWTVGCTDKKPVPMADSVLVDSIPDTMAMDTLEELISEQPIPKAADELFDDFFFNFASNRKFQMGRIQFPLMGEDNKPVAVTKKEWKMERFYFPQNFYTQILDSKKDLKLSKDTSINHVAVEKIFLDEKTVKTYHFDRIEGQWMLTSVVNNEIDANGNASFLNFYQHFATDSAFQRESLNETLEFKGPDPYDDSKDMHETITPDQWEDVSPGELPSGTLYNVVYGGKYATGQQKILLLRGISNGQELELTFKKTTDGWKLVKLVE
jgi:hypothetical protein